MSGNVGLSLDSSGVGTDWTIYTGVWTNWREGGFSGPTLTTTTSGGLILVSFLTIFVSIIGGCVWSTVTYTLHQFRDSPNAVRDGLFHQEQVVLRNSDNATSALIQFLEMAWAWRGRTNIWRLLPLVVLSAAQIGIFTAAGIFSSKIFSTDQTVLVRSPYCGYVKPPPSSELGSLTKAEFAQSDAANVDNRMSASFALSYTRSCYVDNPLPSCKGAFAQDNIPFSARRTECPFDPDICIAKNGALVADTGYINSNEDFGINSKASDSVDYRRVLTCAPLKTKGYTKLDTTLSDKAFGGEELIGYYYGRDIFSDVETTFLHDTVLGNRSQVPYTPMGASWSFSGDIIDTFDPIRQLRRSDADVTLMFVTTNARYSLPSDDLFYQARQKIPDPEEFATHVYGAPPSQPVAVMGCIEQHQMCDPNKSRKEGCTPLSGLASTKTYNATVHNTPAQAAIVAHLRRVVSTSNLFNMIIDHGPNALLATQYLGATINLNSSPLPKNIWEEEIKGWHAYSLALLQKKIVNIAQGPPNAAGKKFVQKPSESLQKDFDVCQNVMIRDGRYYSFKIAGLIIVVAVGLLTITLSFALPGIANRIQQKLNKGVHRKEDWELDHLLQLQRMAYESAQLGTWSRTSSVPVTIKALGVQKFGKPGRTAAGYSEVEMNPITWHPK